MTEERKLTLELIDEILGTLPTVWDNPNGGYVHTCPFCTASKEVSRNESVYTAELIHEEGCIYKLTQQLYKLTS